jgi:hypothetical protein
MRAALPNFKRVFMAKKWRKSNLKAKAAEVAAAGSVGADGAKDTEIIHVNKAEMPIVDRALKRYGGSGKINPRTGKKEYAGEVGGKLGGIGASAGGVGRSQGAIGGSRGKSTEGGTKAVPKSTGPTPEDDTLGASPESAAAALGSGGSQPLGDAPAPDNMPTGVTPMDKKPRGATPYIDKPSAGQLLGTAIGAAAPGGLGLVNAAGDLETDKDGKIKANLDKPTKGGFLGQAIDAAFGGTPGPQTGWSAERTKGVPGDVGGSGGASGTPKSEMAKSSGGKASGSASTASASADEVIPPVVGADGKTITVNPDGTLRNEDTSAAGLRAKKRYGAKPKAKV